MKHEKSEQEKMASENLMCKLSIEYSFNAFFN